MQKMRGCGYEGKTMTILGQEKLKSCPLFYAKQNPMETNTIFRHFRNYKNGFLPGPGGVGDQANPVMEAIYVVDAAVEEARGIKEARGEAERRRNTANGNRRPGGQTARP